jgi:hypothetical protein
MVSGSEEAGMASEVRAAGDRARSSRPYRAMVTLGLIAYGVVHLLIAWVAGQLIWSKRGEEASHQGALRELAGQPLGGVLLWVVAVGLFALVIWQLLDAVIGQRGKEGSDRLWARLKAVGRAAVYLALGVSAAKTATGSGAGGAGSERTMSARLMETGWGRVLVAGVGLAIIAVGVRHLYKAVTARFTEDLTPGVPDGTVLVGRVGYAAKGVAFGVVGALFGWAAISYDPGKAGGLDTALRTVRNGPAGAVLLAATAFGIAAFGIYCLIWSRNAKR